MTTQAPFSLATHNGIVTVRSVRTGEHRTFRVRTQPDDSNFAPGERVASLLSGPDNTRCYTPFGFVQADGSIRLFKSKEGDGPWAKYADMLSHPEAYQRTAEFMFEGRCRRCDRTLSHPESLISGIGPECAKIVAKRGAK